MQPQLADLVWAEKGARGAHRGSRCRRAGTEGRASPPVRTLSPNVRRRPNAAPRRNAGVVGLPAVPNGAPGPRPHPNHLYRKGAIVTRHQQRPRHGDGTAWLVADRAHGDFACYWYIGRAGDHLGEQARVVTAEDAVAWGRARTTRVRIRTADGCSQWAGSAPRPEGLSHTWASPTAAVDQGTDAHWRGEVTSW
jgi:hypothetical protein